MGEKRATSAEGKTIRIAESSDMDSWEAVLGHVQVLEKIGDLKEKMKWMMFYATMPTGRHELMEMNGPWWDMVGKKEEFWRNKQNGDLSGKRF